MKNIVWFSPVLLPEMLKHLGLPSSVRGGWIPGLLSALCQYAPGLNMVVIAVGSIKSEKFFVIDGVTYHILPRKIGFFRSEGTLLLRAKTLITEYNAHVVHVHGTESMFSKLTYDKNLHVPVCVSIQGLLSKCIPHIAAGLTWKEKIMWQSHWRSLVLRDGPVFGWMSWQKKAVREKKVLRSGDFFIGRTLWDRANVHAQNPDAVYFHGDEVLRDVFYTSVDRIESEEKPVILLGRATPIKGIIVFLKMLRILTLWNQPFEARIIGQFRIKSGLGRVLWSKICKYGLKEQVKFLGSLSAADVAQEFSQASVFVHPSFVDNSPNTICEAMILGTPVVATCCGGVPSLIQDGVTGIIVPSGDAESAAEAVKMLLNDAVYRKKISDAARFCALSRHHIETIAQTYFDIYTAVMRTLS